MLGQLTGLHQTPVPELAQGVSPGSQKQRAILHLNTPNKQTPPFCGALKVSCKPTAIPMASWTAAFNELYFKYLLLNLKLAMLLLLGWTQNIVEMKIIGLQVAATVRK